MIFVAPDGTLTIAETQDCAAFVSYSNRFALGASIEIHDYAGLHFVIVKGQGREDETLYITDTTTGAAYTVTVAENETGDLCLPWAMTS